MITSNEEIRIKDDVTQAYKVYLRNVEAGDMKAIETSCSFPLASILIKRLNHLTNFPQVWA